MHKADIVRIAQKCLSKRGIAPCFKAFYVRQCLKLLRCRPDNWLASVSSSLGISCRLTRTDLAQRSNYDDYEPWLDTMGDKRC